MKIKYLGHAAFLFTSDSGVRIITDPYKAGYNGKLNYGEITEPADVVTVSHEHGDHNDAAVVRGNPQIIRASAKVKGMQFLGIPSHHDESGGKERGLNTIFCFVVDGIRICHLGDLGRHLNDKEKEQIGSVDVLLIPVGGFFTIDAKVATEVAESLAPKLIIPMHFKTEKCSFPITGVEDFLKGKKNVSKMDSSEAEFEREKLPTTTQVTVLKSAL
jgi:L-ascorbate metabolism protein UlaG (beta-lactamase superfamily)